ncbi:MAG: TIGR02710 family CRISPR-associated protein [Methanosphaera stadtmanae]|nr:TIGR02710 family CRISPR-associated protein [Methanosphaera stadtmanae]
MMEMSRIMFVLSDEFHVSMDKSKEHLSKMIYEEKIDLVVIVAFPDILNYIPDLKTYYKDNYGEDLNLNVLIIKDLNNMDYVFERFKYKINEFPNSDITINYTNGSNKLSAIGIIIARLYGLKIQDKFEIEDTAKLSEFNVVDERNSGSIMYIIKKLFNNYSYNIAKELLEENYSVLNVVEQRFSGIIDLYYRWDSFDYIFKDYGYLIDFFTNLESLPENIKALEILSDNNNKLFNSYKIADLINNAGRRIEENRYDDAVIRLYKTLELISEVELYEKYGIKKNDVHINELRELNIDKQSLKTIIDRLDYKYPKYNISLKSSFFLLQKLYDDVGKHYYYNKDQYQQLFQKRNISILVHGSYTYNVVEVNQMYELVVSMAKKYDKDMDKYLEATKFPKFKI